MAVMHKIMETTHPDEVPVILRFIDECRPDIRLAHVAFSRSLKNGPHSTILVDVPVDESLRQSARAFLDGWQARGE